MPIRGTFLRQNCFLFFIHLFFRVLFKLSRITGDLEILKVFNGNKQAQNKIYWSLAH